jgi:hypothetical protein
MVEVVIALLPEETVVTTASVLIGTLEPEIPLAPVEAAAAAPPAVTPAAVRDPVSLTQAHIPSFTNNSPEQTDTP